MERRQLLCTCFSRDANVYRVSFCHEVNGDMVDYSLLYYSVARDLWSRLIREVGSQWVFSRNFGSLMVEKPINLGSS